MSEVGIEKMGFATTGLYLDMEDLARRRGVDPDKYMTSAIVNPNDLRLMETIKSCDIFKNHVLYSDSYLEV